MSFPFGGASPRRARSKSIDARMALPFGEGRQSHGVRRRPFGGRGWPSSRALGPSALGTGSGAAPYTGFVATRSFVPTDKIGTVGRYFNSRSLHYARDTINSLQALFPNFYVVNTSSTVETETANGAAITIEASVEYPLGTFTRILFSGVSAGTIPNGGMLLCDAVSVSIPSGALFAIRTNIASTTSAPYFASLVAAPGDGFEASSTPLTNKVMSGTVTQATTSIYGPMAIIGTTRKPSVVMYGDSKLVGSNDTIDASMDVGEIARSIGPTLGYANMGRSGGTLSGFLTSNTNRLAVAQYASHVIVEYLINDLAAGRSKAQMQANMATFLGYFPDKPVMATTITPKTTGAWTLPDGSDQTVTAQEPARVAYNTDLRAGTMSGVSSLLRAVIDTASVLEITLNGGKWKAPGYTNDGTHETQLGYLAIQSAGVVPVASITR